LWQRGCSLLGDDVAIVDLERQTAAPAPRRVSLRSPSRRLLGEALWSRVEGAPSSEPTNEGWVFHPSEIDGRAPGPVSTSAILFLGRTNPDSPGGVLRPLAPAHAALGILPYLNVARRVDVGTLVPRLTPFATAVPAWDVTRADLPTMCAAVERLLEP
jgi:hypothetical protein